MQPNKQYTMQPNWPFFCDRNMARAACKTATSKLLKHTEPNDVVMVRLYAPLDGLSNCPLLKYHAAATPHVVVWHTLRHTPVPQYNDTNNKKIGINEVASTDNTYAQKAKIQMHIQIKFNTAVSRDSHTVPLYVCVIDDAMYKQAPANGMRSHMHQAYNAENAANKTPKTMRYKESSTNPKAARHSQQI